MNESQSNSTAADSSFRDAGGIIKVLSILFVLQLAIGAILKLGELKYQATESKSAPILRCDFTKIAKIVIEDRQGDKVASIVLVKEKNGWKLPQQSDFPASNENVNQLLNSLKELKRGFPETNSADAAERFSLGSKNFAKAIHLFDDKQKEHTLLLGISPRFRSIYVRTPESNDIFAVEMADYQVPANMNEWIDRKVFQLNSQNIVAVDLGIGQVKKEHAKWTLTEQQNKSTELHEGAVRSLIDSIAYLTVSSVLGRKPEDAGINSNPVLSLKVTLIGGKNLEYDFFKPQNKNSVVLKISDKPWYLAVDQWVYDRLKAETPDSLLKRESEITSKAQNAAAIPKLSR